MEATPIDVILKHSGVEFSKQWNYYLVELEMGESDVAGRFTFFSQGRIE